MNVPAVEEPELDFEPELELELEGVVVVVDVPVDELDEPDELDEFDVPAEIAWALCAAAAPVCHPMTSTAIDPKMLPSAARVLTSQTFPCEFGGRGARVLLHPR